MQDREELQRLLDSYDDYDAALVAMRDPPYDEARRHAAFTATNADAAIEEAHDRFTERERAFLQFEVHRLVE